MFYFIETVTHGKNAITWARLISNNIDQHLRRLMRTRKFYMSSYVIYSIARNYEYLGLIYTGVVGRRPGQIKVYDCYPQLNHPPKQHYRNVNDASTMHIMRKLQGGLQERLSLEAQALVEQHSAWFIQFLKFTYIRVQGSLVPPYMLSFCPTNRVVLLEVARQLFAYIKLFTIRDCLDPYGNVKEVLERKHGHRCHLEDYWISIQDDIEVKKKMYSILPLDFIQRCKTFHVADQVQDSGKYLQATYTKEDKEMKFKWVDMEIEDLKELMKPVLEYTHIYR